MGIPAGFRSFDNFCESVFFFDTSASPGPWLSLRCGRHILAGAESSAQCPEICILSVCTPAFRQALQRIIGVFGRVIVRSFWNLGVPVVGQVIGNGTTLSAVTPESECV